MLFHLQIRRSWILSYRSGHFYFNILYKSQNINVSYGTFQHFTIMIFIVMRSITMIILLAKFKTDLEMYTRVMRYLLDI